jgi:adenosylcobyric acid synthase
MKSIMIQGTSSGVGKTVLTLALCRIFRQDGYRVAPFKAQNMTVNTCLTDGGDEIAVSQWLQARAAGAEPRKDMNPIVVNPMAAQNINPADLTRAPVEKLGVIMSAYERLCAADIVRQSLDMELVYKILNSCVRR